LLIDDAASLFRNNFSHMPSRSLYSLWVAIHQSLP
jgi:hypothetical protein